MLIGIHSVARRYTLFRDQLLPAKVYDSFINNLLFKEGEPLNIG